MLCLSINQSTCMYYAVLDGDPSNQRPLSLSLFVTNHTRQTRRRPTDERAEEVRFSNYRCLRFCSNVMSNVNGIQNGKLSAPHQHPSGNGRKARTHARPHARRTAGSEKNRWIFVLCSNFCSQGRNPRPLQPGPPTDGSQRSTTGATVANDLYLESLYAKPRSRFCAQCLP